MYVIHSWVANWIWLFWFQNHDPDNRFSPQKGGGVRRINQSGTPNKHIQLNNPSVPALFLLLMERANMGDAFWPFFSRDGTPLKSPNGHSLHFQSVQTLLFFFFKGLKVLNYNYSWQIIFFHSTDQSINQSINNSINQLIIAALWEIWT